MQDSAKTDTSNPLGDREMSDAELAAEAARGRLTAYSAFVSIAFFAGSIVCSAILAKTASRTTSDAATLTNLHAHKGVYVAGGFFLAAAMAVAGITLLHLALAIASRRASTPKLVPAVAIGGPIAVGITLPILNIAGVSASNEFAGAAEKSAAAAKHALDAGLYKAASMALAFAMFVTAIAWVIVCVFSLRTGLLTRLTAIVGMVIGAFYALGATYAVPLGINSLLQIFWLGSLAILLLFGRDQRPPAWVLGRPVPWSEVQRNAREQAENPADFAKASKPEDAPAIDAPADE